MRLMKIGPLCVWSIAVLVALPEATAAQATSIRLLVPPPPGNTRPVHLTSPRIPPLTDAQLTDTHRRVLAKYRAGEKPGNALRTLATIPELVDGTMPFQEYIATRSSLSPRHRELLILRTAWLLNNDYIWGEHAAAAQRAGLTAGEIHRVAEGPEARSWDRFEAALLRLADELFRNSSVTDADLESARSAVRHVPPARCRHDGHRLHDDRPALQRFRRPARSATQTARIPRDVPVSRRGAAAGASVAQSPAFEPLAGYAAWRSRARSPTTRRSPSRAGAAPNYVNQVSKLDPRFSGNPHLADRVGRAGRVRVGAARRQRRPCERKGLDPLKIAAGSRTPRDGARSSGRCSTPPTSCSPIRQFRIEPGRALADTVRHHDADERNDYGGELSDGLNGAERARRSDRPRRRALPRCAGVSSMTVNVGIRL